MSQAWTPAYRRAVRRRSWTAIVILSAILGYLICDSLVGALPGSAGHPGGGATAAAGERGR